MTTASTRTAALMVASLLGLAGTAEARTFEVTRTNDPNPGNCMRRDCSVREAVLAANTRPGADRVLLPTTRTYRLTRAAAEEDLGAAGDLDVLGDPLRIVHPGRGRATIDAAAIDERLMDVFAPTTLKKLVLTGGAQVDNGSGGAIEAQANLRISNSVLRRNSTEKFGGAISHTGGDLTIDGSKLIRNLALDESGAINATGDRTVIRRSTFRGNRAADSQGGAIYASTELVIERSTFTGNRTVLRGGAVHIDGGEAMISDSTFSANRAQENGGAISSYSTNAEIVNSTFSGNRAVGDGGAIWNGGNIVINAVTVARNVSDSDDDGNGAGGGIYNSGGSEVEIANSVLALNVQLGGDAEDCFGIFSSSGGNLRSNGDFCSNGFDESGDAVRANPKIGQLRSNGGPTQTIELKQGSPAIGRAIEALAPARDQRGRRRDDNPDAGAFERGA